MSAQKIATGLALAALTSLFLWVGMPALLPPHPVAEIKMTVPPAKVAEGSPRNEVAPSDTRPPAPADRPGDDDAGADSGGDDSGSDSDDDSDDPDASDGSDDDSGDDD